MMSEYCMIETASDNEEEIKNRYGENSEVYNKCCKLVDKINI